MMGAFCILLLLVCTIVSTASAQKVNEIVRFKKNYRDNSLPSEAASSIRASRFGVAIVTGGSYVPGTEIIDIVSTVYYLKDSNLKVHRLDVRIPNRWASQAVVGDSVLYVGLSAIRGIDSTYASIDLNGGAVTYFSSEYNRASVATHISLFNGMLAGLSRSTGPVILDLERRQASSVDISNATLSDYKYEIIALQDSTFILMPGNGVMTSREGGLPAFREGRLTRPSYNWSTVCTLSEIGDSVYWPIISTNGVAICAMSTITGDGVCTEFHPEAKFDGVNRGLVGVHGALFVNTIYDNKKELMRARYFYKSKPEPVDFVLPVTDSVITLHGGAWWNGHFYIAVRLGEANETVVYEIAEPAPVVSVSETKLPDGTATTHRMAFTQSRFAAWIRELHDTNVEIYDVLGVRQQTSSIRPGLYAVRVGEQVNIVVVTDYE